MGRIHLLKRYSMYLGYVQPIKYMANSRETFLSYHEW